MVDKTVNAGVAALQGFALQRNMALYIILDNYEAKFKCHKYFVNLEHLEDLLFCFLNEDGESVSIEAYQSKKNSSGAWRINKKMAEIVFKLLGTGNGILNDPYPKAPGYYHQLNFSSNATMHLEKKIKERKSGKSKTYTEIINEQNIICSFGSLDKNIQKAIQESIEKHYKSPLKMELEKELKNLQFGFIEFTRTDKEQKIQLDGKLSDVFDKKIHDNKAALRALFSLFETVELTYNQKSTARLSDTTKRVESDEINSALMIITTKSKAFDYWRNEKKSISQTLGIKPFEKEIFALKFESSFDLFKSNDEAEHQKIFHFVKENYMDCKSYQEEECVLELYELFDKSKNTTLDEMNLKAAIYAAYFESIFKTEF